MFCTGQKKQLEDLGNFQLAIFISNEKQVSTLCLLHQYSKVSHKDMKNKHAFLHLLKHCRQKSKNISSISFFLITFSVFLCVNFFCFVDHVSGPLSSFAKFQPVLLANRERCVPANGIIYSITINWLQILFA